MSTRQTGNQALQGALEEKGIRTERDRTKFAESIGITDRTLRRWLSNEIKTPGPYWRHKTAKRLGVDSDALWPAEETVA